MTSSWMAQCASWFRRLLGRADGGAREEIDPDVREVFLGELDETSEMLLGLLPDWKANPDDPEVLQTIRRGFHTLKGSGLMVGAKTLGDFCGRIEQLALDLIERRAKAAPDLVTIIEDAIRVLPDCSRAIQANTAMPARLHEVAQRALRKLGPG